MSNTKSEILDAVRATYGNAAVSALSNRDASVRKVAEAFGYSSDELQQIPADANLGLSCGNPVATAHLRAGEVVIDLGSGGGLDVFLAARKVGPTGRAIGIDMTPEMVDRAREAARRGVDGKPVENVEFHLSTIDQIPLDDETVDVILSNCVINLAPDKRAVFREMYRVLRPGGRVAVSDIALKKTLPADIANDIAAYSGCIAGAVSFSDYESGLRQAGFVDVVIVDAKSDLNAYSQIEGQTACCSPTKAESHAASAASDAGCCSTGERKRSLKIAVSSGGEATSSCCSTGGRSAPLPETPVASEASFASGHELKSEVHGHLSDLLRRYDINEYAASVKVFAIKPR